MYTVLKNVGKSLFIFKFCNETNGFLASFNIQKKNIDMCMALYIASNTNKFNFNFAYSIKR